MLILELTLLNRIVSVISSALQAIMAMPDSQSGLLCKPKQAGGGRRSTPPFLFFCPNTHINTITLKFFFTKNIVNIEKVFFVFRLFKILKLEYLFIKVYFKNGYQIFI